MGDYRAGVGRRGYIIRNGEKEFGTRRGRFSDIHEKDEKSPGLGWCSILRRREAITNDRNEGIGQNGYTTQR